MESEPVFDFGGALERMRIGHHVRRRVWGPDVFLVLIKGRPAGVILIHDAAGWHEWAAPQHELLAYDWETVKPPLPAVRDENVAGVLMPERRL